MREAPDLDQRRAFDFVAGLAAVDIDARHPFGLEVAVLEENAGNHDAAEVMAPDRPRHGAALGG